LVAQQRLDPNVGAINTLRFFFVGRRKVALRRLGENVSSTEVEKYLLARE
jgi:acyl-CoA synthetase (AMP-forming)/AMP-acid ligase II